MALRGATPCARTGQSSREVRGARACALGFEASERASAGGARRCGGGAAGAYERLRAHTGDAQRGRSVARRARGSTAAFAQGRKLIFRLLPLSSELSCAPQPCRGSLLRSTALQDQRRGHLHKSEAQHPPLCERDARSELARRAPAHHRSGETFSGAGVKVRQSGRKWRKWCGARCRAPNVLLSAFRVPPTPVVPPAKAGAPTRPGVAQQG